MFSTNEVLKALQKANPDSEVLEDHLRNALRRGNIPHPKLFAGRYAWTTGVISMLCKYLKLNPPKYEGVSNDTT